MSAIALEVCIDSVASAVAAEKGGATRVELCADLDHGGTTPSTGMMEEVSKHVSIKLHVIIRPRAGNFCYSDLEFEVMKKDIINAKTLGVNGVALGILDGNGAIDITRVKTLIDLAHPLSVTFHRAFDEAIEPSSSLEKLIDLGIDRVLTSGQKEKAIEGCDCLRTLVEQSKGRINIMPGSGINEQNAKTILSSTGAKELHVGSSVTTMNNTNVQSNSFFAAPQHVVDAVRVQRLLSVMKS